MRRRSDGSGQALVEFALVIPIFLLLLFGLIDGGRYVYMSNVLSQAAREAARVGAAEASWIGATTANDPLRALRMLPRSRQRTRVPTSAQPRSTEQPTVSRRTSPLPRTGWSLHLAP